MCYVAIFNLYGSLENLAMNIREFYNVYVVDNTLCFDDISGAELSELMEYYGLDYNYSFESPADAWTVDY